MENRAQKGKIAAKKQDFRGQMRVIGPVEFRSGNQSRKAKWCKMQVLFLELYTLEDVKSKKQWLFAYF